MKLFLKTKVNGDYRMVMEGFNRDLFEFLKPPGARMEILEFTGSQKGDRVHLKFISPIKAEWLSLITEDGEKSDELYFVDEGKELPAPLVSWRHYHGVKRAGSQHAWVIDDIEYSTGRRWLDYLMWPVMYIAFSLRKPRYKEFFAKK